MLFGALRMRDSNREVHVSLKATSLLTFPKNVQLINLRGLIDAESDNQ